MINAPWKFANLNVWDDELCDTIPFVEVPFDYKSTAEGYNGNPSIVDCNGDEVVGCNEYNVFSSVESIRLLTLSPEVLQGLENLLEAYEEFQNPEDGVAQDAREIIKKVRGL